MNKCLILLATIFISSIRAIPISDNKTVTIAVVEYQPISDLSAETRVHKNAEKYLQLLKSLNSTNLDMIIYPEAALGDDHTTATEIAVGENPCDSPAYPDHIRNISCAAREYNTYVVINVAEKEKCEENRTSTNCQQSGYSYYNCDVVFDRNGNIFQRYRKFNLFMEFFTDRPSSPEIVVFETDFGVKFGIFTCFDILFRGPADEVVKQNEIDAVIYPTMWHSQLPFLTSLQTQQMWAHTHNVKLFAAGGNVPSLGSGGSGIYSGADGMIIGDIIASGGSQVYLYEFVPGGSPINPQPPTPVRDPDVLAKEMDSFYIMPDDTLTVYNSTVLTTGGFSGQLCYDKGTENHLCCEFSVKTSEDSSKFGGKYEYVYHLLVYSGVRHSFGTDAGLEICAIIACPNSSLASCGQRFPDHDAISWPLTFEEISIKANFEIDEKRTQFPNSLLSSIRPINASDTVWEGKEVEIDGKTMMERRFTTKRPQNRLLTFAILGRNFAYDSPMSVHRVGKNNSSRLAGFDCFLFVFVAVLAGFITK